MRKTALPFRLVSSNARKTAPGRKAETLAERLRRLRREKGLTQAELAQAIGTSQPSIAHYERRGDVPGPHALLKLSEVLGVPPEEILGGKRGRGSKKTRSSPENLRLWRRLKLVETLPPAEQKHVLQ